MRILVAMMKHETNTFSPIPTTLDRFFEWGGGTWVMMHTMHTRAPACPFRHI